MGTTTGATLFSDILYKTLLQHFSTTLFSSTSLLLNTWNLHYTERSNPSNAKHNRTTDCGNRTSQHKACNTHYSALSKPNMQIAGKHISKTRSLQWFPSLEQRHMPTKHNACHEIWRNAEGIHPLRVPRTTKSHHFNHCRKHRTQSVVSHHIQNIANSLHIQEDRTSTKCCAGPTTGKAPPFNAEIHFVHMPP